MARTLDAARRTSGVRDPRLLVGIVLVLASVAGVVGLVSAIDRRTVVYAAADALAPGDRIQVDDLVERSVSLDGIDDLYLQRDDIPEDGLVVLSAVRRGEMVPRSALGDTAGADATTLVLELGSPVSTAVVAGADVDVWASPFSAETRTFEAPAVLVPGALVVAVLGEDGLVTSGSGARVEVQVPRDVVARVLHATAAGDELAVVPAGIPLG